MKLKELLAYGTILCSLLGCSDDQEIEQIPQESLNLYKELQTLDYGERQKKLEQHSRNYLFKHYTRLESKEDFYAPSTYNATLSKNAKNLVGKLWSSLHELGFEGYSPRLLDHNSVSFSYSEPEILTGDRISGVSYQYQEPSFMNRPFHEKVMILLMDESAGIRYLMRSNKKETDAFSPMFIGLSIKGQLIRLHDTSIYSPLSHSGPQYYYNYYLAYENDGTEVPPADYLKWNQTIIDVLKEDPFFKQFFEPAALSDGTGSVSLLSARKGSIGADATSFNVNGMSGSKVDLGLPFYVQLKGSVDHGKSTNLTTGTVAYKVGNTVVGAIQSYANSGAGFGIEGHQLETSVVVSHSFGSLFLEGQLGSVSAKDVHFKDWFGMRSQVTVGIDTPWVSPFVQFTHRDFGDKTDTATYAGLEVDLSELKAESYSFSTHLLTKVGHHSVHGITGAVEWYGSLNLHSGLSFTSYLTIDTMAEPAAGLNFMVNR